MIIVIALPNEYHATVQGLPSIFKVNFYWYLMKRQALINRKVWYLYRMTNNACTPIDTCCINQARSERTRGLLPVWLSVD